MFGIRERYKSVGYAVAACIAAATVGASAMAQEVDFAGKEITLIIPYGPGGGTTAYARLFQMALQETLPGQPTILPRNIDGGGSVVGTNEFAATAEPDGLTYLAIGSSTLLNQIFGDDVVRYDLTKMVPFTSSPGGSIVYGLSDYSGGLTDDPVENTRAFMENPPVIAAQTLTSSDLGMLVSYDLIGIKPQVVFGLSLGDSRPGFQRGEFQMRHDTMLSYHDHVAPLLEDGTAKPLFTMGFEKDGEMVRDPVAPDVPHFLEVYETIHGKPLSGIEYDVWKSLFDLRVMAGKMLLLPEGTPDHIVEAYAQATRDALELPMMKDEAAQLILGNYPQVVGAERARRVLNSALGLTAEQREWLNNWADEVYGGF